MSVTLDKKYAAIDAVDYWAEQIEAEETAKTASGFGRLKCALSQAFAKLGPNQDADLASSPFIHKEPLKIGVLVHDFNGASDALGQTDYVTTYDQAVYIRAGRGENDPQYCFHIAHTGGDKYLCTETLDPTDMANAVNVKEVRGRQALNTYLLCELPQNIC